MSINVTVNGNRLNICRGRMVLSDLDQIKKNERDRRRRLRLEQVRQQSKEISDRLLERNKNIAKEELRKIENNDKLNLKHMYNGKIMEVQQKYQEDMADIGQAHISAALEPDHDAMIEERERKNKSLALKRGKEAIKLMKNTQQMESAEQQHQERLRQVREVENLRSTMIAKLPKKVIPDTYTVCVSVENETDEGKKCQNHVRKKAKKICTKQSPGKVTKPYMKKTPRNDTKTCSPVSWPKIILEDNSEKDCTTLDRQPVIDIVAESLTEQTRCATESEYNDQNCAKEIINVPINVDRSSRYNPEDYIQTSSDPTNSDSSNSFSDDSSYFSDSGDQYMTKEVKMTRHVKCPALDKVQLYDHNKHQSNLYDQPLDVVEKIQTWKEPSAIDLAQEIKRATASEIHLSEYRKQNTQKRGEDAALREKVRRDYQILMQNLSQLASEERKLKASQINSYPNDVYIQQERRKVLRNQHKKKLSRALNTLLNEEQCVSCSVERPITLTPKEHAESSDIHASWEDPVSFNQRVKIDKPLQMEYNENGASREEQILDMLKKVERQKRLLLQEFGADLPNEVFNASVKSLFEKDKSVQTEVRNSKDVQSPLSPEVKVITVLPDAKNNKDKSEKKDDSSVKKVETAVQTITGPRSILQDKSTQVELEQGKETVPTFVHEEVETITQHYPIEPQVIIVRPEMDSSDSTSSESIQFDTDNNRQTAGATPKKKRYITKTKKTPSKMIHKSCSTRSRKIVSPAKKVSKVSSGSQSSGPNKYPNVEDVPRKKIKMYVDKNGINIKVKPSKVAEVAVDMSTQSTQIYTTDIQGEPTTKSQWVQTKSKRIKIKDMSDTSTTFASPPPIKPRDLLEALNNNMSILEMLDSSANETIKRLRNDVSPVSTPETPSPRTMMMPSNIPHPEKLKKLLGFTSTDSSTNDNSTLSSSKNDYSASTDLSEYQRNEHVSAESVTVQTKVPISLEFCLCNNPECKQMHAKFDEIRTYALKNCPQILQKYEDLQTTCAERIVSLTNLIEKVRNEQRDMGFSMIDQHNETRLMQLPSRVVTNDLQSVRVLVETIEAIHNQLTKTLMESQKIIEDKVGVQEDVDEIKETIHLANNEMSTNINIVEAKIEVDKEKLKPKIINEEKVNIQFNKSKVQKSTQNITSSTPKHSTRFSPENLEEDMIEKLSKEILEQSEGINNNFTQSRHNYNPTVRLSIQTSTDDFNTNTSMKMQRNDIGTRRQINRESKNSKDFVPLLADIPKVPKTTENSMPSNNGRSKPPVSLLSGPYRSEIESSGHELSTIIEFDTPDTVNKSHNNRSPLSTKTIAETHTNKPTIIKVPEHIATSYNAHNTSSEKICTSSITKLSSLESTHKIREASTSFDTSKTSKNVENQRIMKNNDAKLHDIVQETINKKLKSESINQGSLQINNMHRFCSIDAESNDKFLNKDRITSTSSNSFSDLSGVSQIASTPSSTILKYASSPEEIETALKKLGLGWAITTLKKTREASALSSSSNSDVTPINTVKRIISPVKKQFSGNYGLPDFSDVSSISIKEASKSTEQAVLLRGRTSTPKLQNSNSNSGETNISNMNNSENLQEPDNGLIIPKLTLAKSKPNLRKLENL